MLKTMLKVLILLSVAQQVSADASLPGAQAVLRIVLSVPPKIHEVPVAANLVRQKLASCAHCAVLDSTSYRSEGLRTCLPPGYELASKENQLVVRIVSV